MGPPVTPPSASTPRPKSDAGTRDANIPPHLLPAIGEHLRSNHRGRRRVALSVRPGFTSPPRPSDLLPSVLSGPRRWWTFTQRSGPAQPGSPRTCSYRSWLPPRRERGAPRLSAGPPRPASVQPHGQDAHDLDASAHRHRIPLRPRRPTSGSAPHSPHAYRITKMEAVPVGFRVTARPGRGIHRAHHRGQSSTDVGPAPSLGAHERLARCDWELVLRAIPHLSPTTTAPVLRFRSSGAVSVGGRYWV